MNAQAMRVGSRTMMIAGLFALGVAGLIFGIVYLFSPREPSYQGKTLSEWVAPFCRQTAKGLEAPGGPEHFEELQPVRQAVREMGTNAVPFLIARLDHRESRLHRTARQLLEKQPIAGLRLTDPNVSKIRAIRALAILGRAAAPAIPSLKAQVADATVSQHAVYALSGMGAEGMRALVEEYTNVPAPLRVEIAVIVVFPASVYRGQVSGTSVPVSAIDVSTSKAATQFQTNEIPADILIEGLSLVAKDAASPFQTPAIQRLGGFGPKASTAIPVLVQVLNEHNSRTLQSTIFALGKIRSQPEVVVPALTKLLSHPEPRISKAAALALREFGYDVPVQPGVPRVMHPPLPVRTNEVRYY